METEDKGVYGIAEELGQKDKDLESGKPQIYGESEELAKKNVEEIHKFMADPNGRHPKAEKKITDTPEDAVSPEDSQKSTAKAQGVYTQATELGEKDREIEESGQSIYSEAEELAQKNVEDIHQFMADPNGKKKL
ncbi:hypothetical protein [Acetobacterium wieringae]|uniref:hypothetical protein n=1 Tax=Acetobacterium wieringae TaxID=52694 RepID=UPI0026EB340C|nr:hypothetical protein [Acetobacterium wieringae]